MFLFFLPMLHVARMKKHSRLMSIIIDQYRLLTLRRLMSYIYMEHPFLMFLDHTQRRSTFGRTPLDE